MDLDKTQKAIKEKLTDEKIREAEKASPEFAEILRSGLWTTTTAQGKEVFKETIPYLNTHLQTSKELIPLLLVAPKEVIFNLRQCLLLGYYLCLRDNNLLREES